MKSLVFLLGLLLSVLCYSTEQIAEELNIIGATFKISAYPLKSHPKYKELVQKIDSRWSSACARGYKAEWVIYDKKLWLKMLFKNPCSNNSELLDLKLFFDINSKTQAVFANWYSGRITYQIGPSKRLNQDGIELRGIEYEAVVYSISKGNVQSRNIEIIEEIWDK